jgi:hypothetical protein
MEGHGEAFCGLYKATKEGLVYGSVSCKTADDDAVSAQLASHTNVGKHSLYLNRSIEEVSAAWADDDVELDIDSSACGEDLTIGGGRTPLGETSAELDSIGSAQLSSAGALGTPCAVLYPIGTHYCLSGG